MPRKVPLQSYKHAMLKLREKGYSYQEVAVWLSKQLDVPVTRNQVAYVVNMEPDLEQEEAEAEREAEDTARA
jgi:cation transport regulator ChaC